TNEIAQSEAYIGHKWCNFWFHVHHLNTSNGTMSKSKGEFLTVSLLEEKGYDPLVYRFFCMQSHYRKSLVFTYENLDNAAKAYEKLVARIAALKDDGETEPEAFEKLKAGFAEAMDNDLNTSLAVTALYDVLKADCNDATKKALVADFDKVLSLGLCEAAEKKRQEEALSANPELVAKIEEMIEQRAQAKKDKDYAAADAIRSQLLDMGVVLEDTKEGTKFKIVK
ncbi:MAG: cysteine--tRNA ligase, partial [Clostridia bacterium]|nr:cysteine--tRNA ligase [Clostridia bacterium]